MINGWLYFGERFFLVTTHCLIFVDFFHFFLVLMSTKAELEVLGRFITQFLEERPHSKERAVILTVALGELEKVTAEENGYWNRKRVRTWFWNHRSETDVPAKPRRKKMASPPSTRRSPSREGSPPRKRPRRQLTSSVSFALFDSSEESDERSDYSSHEGEQTDSDSEREQQDKNCNPHHAVSMAGFTAVSLQRRFHQTEVQRSQSISFAMNNMLFYRIYASRAIGPDRCVHERWFSATTGFICFFKDMKVGRILWKHDYEYNTFCGSISDPEDSGEPSQWTKYSMYGKSGRQIMQNRSSLLKDKFLCFFKHLDASHMPKIREGTKKRLQADIELFGNDRWNAENVQTHLEVKENDFLGRLQFSSTQNQLCGVSIASRPIILPNSPSEQAKFFSSLPLAELRTVIRTIQDGITNSNKSMIVAQE